MALVVPLVAVLLLAIVQVGLVVRDQVLVVHAAREGARAAAVDPRPGVADRAAKASSSLKESRVSTETVTSHSGGVSDIVTVRVVYRAGTDVPLVGALLPEITLHGKAVMRVEYGTKWTARGQKATEIGRSRVTDRRMPRQQG